MKKVELFTAFYWRCPDCGYVNHCLPESVPEEMEEEAYRHVNGLEEWEPTPEDIADEIVAAPDEVTCQDCAAVFDVDFPEDDDELEDEWGDEGWSEDWLDAGSDF